MEITHNTDNSLRDLSSLDEGQELKKKKRQDIDPPPSPLQVLAVGLFLQVCFWSTPTACSGHVCLAWRYSRQCVSVNVCVIESVCVNSCPCADPAELQPASLVPTDPSCCPIAWRKAITLKQHNTLAVSCRCLLSFFCSFLTISGCICHAYSSLPLKLHNSGPEVVVSHLKIYSHICINPSLLSFCWLRVWAAYCVIRQCFCLSHSD